MRRRSWWLLVIGFVLGVLAAGLVATVVVDRGREPAQIAQGDVYSTDAGDPLDVFYGPGDRGLGCMYVGAFYYGSGISCSDPAAVDETGSWVLVIPEVKRKPPFVVGIMPADATGADVRIGSRSVRADTRGRWFLAPLPAGSLGPNNDAPVSVQFSVHL
jgi:hypothetical protein